MPIYEGTTAIQSNDLIGRKVIRNQGATAAELFALVEQTVADLRAVAGAAEAGGAGAAGAAGAAVAGDAGVGRAGAVAGRAADRLERAAASARRATADLVGFADAPRDAHAVSVPYLMLLGVLAGGWMHGLAVVAVAAHETPDAADADRLTLADFYGAHHLPRVHALAETVASGETA